MWCPPSLLLTPLSPCHIIFVVVPKLWSSLRALYCSSPLSPLVWGWPLLWKRILPSKRNSSPSSPSSSLELLLFLSSSAFPHPLPPLRPFSPSFSIEYHYTDARLTGEELSPEWKTSSTVFKSYPRYTWAYSRYLVMFM